MAYVTVLYHLTGQNEGVIISHDLFKLQANPMIIIVGAGLAGLTAAKVLRQRNLPVTLLEASDGIGGRVRSDYQDGFTIDRGFQVFFTAYPAARRHLDYARLDFREFDPGAIIAKAGHSTILADPLRRPQHLFATLASNAITLGDKLKVAQLTADLWRHSAEQINARRDSTSTLAYLKQYGFSDTFIANFARPFFGGVFLDRQLNTSARIFRFDYKMLAAGRTVIPAAGIQAIANQLGEASQGQIRLQTPIEALLRDGKGRVVGVRTATGEELEADAVVIATDAATAAQLTGLTLPTAHVSAACVYFAADRSLYDERLIMLNANGNAFVNNVQQLTNVAPEYAPAGKHLISCAIVGLPALSDAAMFARAREDLARLFTDSAVNTLLPLRVNRIEFAQFVQPAGIKATLPANFTGIPGLYFAAEFTSYSSINGAIFSGEQAAVAIIAHHTAAPAS